MGGDSLRTIRHELMIKCELSGGELRLDSDRPEWVVPVTDAELSEVKWGRVR